MTQTFPIMLSKGPLARLREWLLALDDNDLRPDKPAKQPADLDECDLDRDDAFYLAFGMHRHW